MPIPRGDAGFSVSPDELSGAGRSAQGIAEQLPGEIKGLLGPSDQATGALAGWATGSALHDCTYDWQKLLDGLAASMDTYGAKLIQMAQGYQQSDQGVASDLQAVQRAGGPGASYQAAAQAGAADPFETVLSGGPARSAANRRRYEGE